jgi:hypothetical protein
LKLSKQGKWVMSTEQLTNDGLLATQLRRDLHTHSESGMNSTLAMAGRSHEIKIDESHRVLNLPASGDGHAFYVALIVGMLGVTCGLAWIILNTSALPFDLASTGASTGNPHLDPKAVAPNLQQGSNSPSAQMTDTQKGDRLQIHDAIARNVDRDALAATLQSLDLSSASTASVGAAPSKHSTGVQRTGVRAEELRSPTKPLTQPKETRPTTIQGWTLREVSNGTAVLEGPNGIWRVTPGQTVPGVGKVDSIVRWGNRLIVATSSGLISTP